VLEFLAGLILLMIVIILVAKFPKLFGSIFAVCVVIAGVGFGYLYYTDVQSQKKYAESARRTETYFAGQQLLVSYDPADCFVDKPWRLETRNSGTKPEDFSWRLTVDLSFYPEQYATPIKKHDNISMDTTEALCFDGPVTGDLRIEAKAKHLGEVVASRAIKLSLAPESPEATKQGKLRPGETRTYDGWSIKRIN